MTHILLDGRVHADLRFFIDLEPGTLYLGPEALPWISALLVPATIWLIALFVRSVSGSLGSYRERRVQGGTTKRSA